MYKMCNPNPNGKRVGDCVVRAISILTGKEWGEVYAGLAMQGFIMGDMPSSNDVWGAYLIQQGYKRKAVPDECPDCYTVQDFCRDHPTGKYLLSLPSHVVSVINGDHYDIWDSADEVVHFYWEAKDNG